MATSLPMTTKAAAKLLWRLIPDQSRTSGFDKPLQQDTVGNTRLKTSLVPTPAGYMGDPELRQPPAPSSTHP